MYSIQKQIAGNIKKVTLILFILLATMFVTAISLVDFEYNISKLISSSNKEIADKLNLVGQIGSVEQLLFDISLKAKQNTPANEISKKNLIKIASLFQKELHKTKQFKSILFKVKNKQTEKLYHTLYDKSFVFFKPQLFNKKDFYNDDVIREKLEAVKFKLLSLESIITKAQLLRDPLGITEKSLKSIMLGNITYNIKVINNVLFSQDEKHILIVTKTRFKSFDINEGQALLDKINQIISDMKKKVTPDFQIKLLGGHIYAVSSANLIKRDLTTIFILSSLGIILLYSLSFRNIRVLFLSLIPIFSGIISGFFMVSVIFGNIHGITLVFGSTLIGICIDYSLHYFSSYIMNNNNTSESGIQAINRVKKSLFFGYLSTSIIFVVFIFSDLKFLQEVAVFSISGISVAFIITIFILPHYRFKSSIKKGILINKLSLLLHAANNFSFNRRNAILIIISIIFVTSLYLAVNNQFDNDITKLNYNSKEIMEKEHEFHNRYGDLSSSYMIVIKSQSLDDILQKNDLIYQILSEAKKNKLINGFFNIHPFLPSKKTQQKHINQLLSLNWPIIKTKIDRVARNLGFNNDAFLPFYQDITKAKSGEYPYITLQNIKQSPFNSFIDESLLKRNNYYYLFSYFKSLPNSDNTLLIKKLNQPKDNIYYINQIDLIKQVMTMLKQEMSYFLLMAFIIIGMVLLILYKDIKKSLIAVMPAILGITCSLALFSLFDHNINIISLFAIILVLGIGLDYGIFMLGGMNKKIDNHTPLAIIIAALTTILSFGILIISKNVALSSIGMIILPGIFFTVIFALFLVPALHALLYKKGKHDES